MRFARTCLGIVFALGAASLVDTASAAPDDQTAAEPTAQPTSNAATETTTAPANRRQAREQRRQQAEAAAAAAASAQPAQPKVAAAAATSEAAPPPAAPKQICKNMDVMGSKIPRRVCATQDEWAVYENRGREDAQDGLRRLRDQGAVAPPSPAVNTSPSVFSPPTR